LGRTAGPHRPRISGGPCFQTFLSKIDLTGRIARERDFSAQLTMTDEGRRPMMTGTVKFYNDQKGYGFIQPDDGGKDVFVHATALERAGLRGLVEGQKVTFEVENDRRSGKPAATNLQAA
jgi:CspA family cold shock protein